MNIKRWLFALTLFVGVIIFALVTSISTEDQIYTSVLLGIILFLCLVRPQDKKRGYGAAPLVWFLVAVAGTWALWTMFGWWSVWYAGFLLFLLWRIDGEGGW